MKKYAVIVLAPVLILILAGCNVLGINFVNGSGNITSETRQVSGFNQISLSGSGDLDIQQGQTEALVIEADDNILPLIKTEVQGQTLKISLEQNGFPVSIHTRKPIQYHLTVKEITDVTVSGSANITSNNLQTGNFSVTINGSGDTNFSQLTADSLTSTISGSGKFAMDGKANTQKVVINGSGSYMADDLSGQSVTIQISGSGKARVWASDMLQVTINGSGEVGYYGNPQISQSISGSGKISSLGNK